MISAQHLTKRFTRGRLALDDVSFTVEEHEIVGLLGHNGAGKSTALGIMLGMVRPDAGEVILAGHSVQKDRCTALRHVGSIFEAPSFYDYMSGWQNLKTLCALSGWWEEKEVWRILEIVRLQDRIHGKVSTYSHGMRQRLALAQALLPMPRILLLDEPTDGLDPEGIHEFRSTILRLRAEHGLTILLNSHLLTEVEQMCDRCIVLREGRKVYEGPVKATQQGLPRYTLETADTALVASVSERFGLKLINDHTIETAADVTGSSVLALLVKAGVAVDSWTPQRRTLEDWYLQLTHPGGNPTLPSP